MYVANIGVEIFANLGGKDWFEANLFYYIRLLHKGNSNVHVAHKHRLEAALRRIGWERLRRFPRPSCWIKGKGEK